jgi:hypothetical protein
MYNADANQLLPSRVELTPTMFGFNMRLGLGCSRLTLLWAASLRDPLKFPDLIHSQKRDGRGLRSWTMRWDFWGHSPEATHQVPISFPCF